jgi:diguanylate cyclase (GGDEF)-like protein
LAWQDGDWPFCCSSGGDPFDLPGARGIGNVRNVLTLRRVISLVAPGALLLLFAWAVQQEEAVQVAAIPYAAFICFGTLAGSVLLSWYHNYARVLSASVVSAMAIWMFAHSAPDDVIKPAVAFLLPLNFALFASLKERGLMTFEGALKAGIIGIQVLLMRLLFESDLKTLQAFLRWGEYSARWTWLSWTVVASFGAAALLLAVLICLRRTSVEAGLLWALGGMFLGMNHVADPVALYLYGSAVGLVLTFAVLEHGFDMAYRDELTGLPGRRAFNEVLQQLRRRYTIAMCDVDNFKKFNDTYGHEVGDQILKTVASLLFSVKGGGRAFRFGGEEFALVFNGRSASEVQPFVEAMRNEIAQMDLVLNGGEQALLKRGSGTPSIAVNLTISVGVADSSGQHVRPEVVLEAADAALYCAKAAGKNCVKLVENVPA